VDTVDHLQHHLIHVYNQSIDRTSYQCTQLNFTRPKQNSTKSNITTTETYCNLPCQIMGMSINSTGSICTFPLTPNYLHFVCATISLY